MGRELIFSDARIISLINDNFVAVAMDDFFQRRRQDAEGEFFRKVADQGPRKGVGGSTRQGIYAFTSDGKLLQYRNHHDPAVMRKFLEDALVTWKKLPASQRAKGSIEVPDLARIDTRWVPTMPKDTLIVNVHARILDRDNDSFSPGTCRFPGGQRASQDHLWIRAEEWQALMPKDAKEGQQIAIPEKLLYRLARFHLVDNTRGEPPMWQSREIRKADVKLVVEKVQATQVRLKLTGSLVLATDADLDKASRGYDVSLLGELCYQPAQRKITKFNVVAVGDHWGEGTYTRGARPGRQPLGVAFELADPSRAASRVPPQAMREAGNYWGAER